MRMTANQARRILSAAGITWHDRATLTAQRDRAYDPIIKTACDIMLTVTLWGVQRERQYADTKSK